MNEILKARAPTTDLDLRHSVRREPGYEPKDRLSLEATESSIVDRFCARRHYSLALINTLSAEDMQLQSMPDTSPTKWHLAHTTWFFEQFILVSYINNYQSPQPQFNYLFNSYYEQKGQRHPRAQRGMLSRPSLEQVLAYREKINKGICDLLQNSELLANESRLELMALVELGMHHEMQHQELMLTDILHCLSQNPLYPAIFSAKSASGQGKELVDSGSNQFSFHPGGLQEFGVKQQSGFYFDCEGPRHKAYVNPFAMAKGLVTNGDWLAFILDGGYYKPTLWLSDGWAWAQKQDWQSPLYWRKQGHDWYQFTLHGLQPLDMSAPVCHISFYEADAYAQWKGCRLPREYEWELFARDLTIAGNFSENHIFTPQISDKPGDMQLYGDVWEWTRSPYTPYPGYQIPEGAVGEYNGKFMSGQYVLRGGSCVTPIEQMRATYRTFFYPHQRWQFMGLRLAKDC